MAAIGEDAARLRVLDNRIWQAKNNGAPPLTNEELNEYAELIAKPALSIASAPLATGYALRDGNYGEAAVAAGGMIPLGNGGKAVKTADEIATLARVEAQLADESAALTRIAKNPVGPVVEGKAAGTVLNQQLIKRAEAISTAKPGQAIAPRDLNEQVLWNQVKADPASGINLGLNNDPRFPTSAGFRKMQATHELPDGTSITIHYQYNTSTGKAYDMKIVTPQRSPLQPGSSRGL